MAAGYHDFTAGEVLTAANLEDYCQNQSMMRFASAAARDTALSGVLTEGLHAYLIDTNTMCVYTGSAWSTVGPVHGTGISWTPTVDQGVTTNIAKTSSSCVYWRIGRLVIVQGTITMSGAGTLGSAITVNGLPVSAATSTGNDTMGSFMYKDSGTAFYSGMVIMNAGTTFQGIAHNAASAIGTTPSFAIANTDVISFNFSYTASADA